MNSPAMNPGKPVELQVTPLPQGDLVQIPREELQTVIHDLRNHLNSLLMNAGVVAAACKDRERFGRYIEQFEREGERCAEELQGLSDRHL